MKKLSILITFLVLVTCVIVNAGKSIPLDFNERESYIIALYKGDRVYFEFDNDVHSVILDDIKDNRIELDIFLYQDTKFNKHPPQYAFLDIYRTLKIDTNKDLTYDFEIKMDSFDEKKAILTFTKTNEKKEGFFTEIDYDTNKNNGYDWKTVGIPLIVIVALVIVLLVFLNNYLRKRKGIYY
ncbi:MAG: hypothetical protein KKG75_02645 [Nanoarchaeota archaeon]|nr:hypothetical protein [Nanoarchaeota archaeon]